MHLILIDEQDNIIGTAEKMLVHKVGMLHRAFSIFVFRKIDDDIQVLLQKRHIHKYHSGGLWANSCCGHPGAEHSVMFYANTRLQEELGINIKLYYLDFFIYKANITNNDNTFIEHELDHVFVGVYQSNEDILFNCKEVDEIKWLSINNFQLKLLNEPEHFTVWVALVWSVVKQNLFFVNNLLSVAVK